MGARNLGSMFDFSDVFETMWGDEPTGGKGEIATANLRDVGAEDGVSATDVELWGPGCVVYRPAPPSKDGKCQALTAVVGGRTVGIATQDLRSNKATGAMNPGDAAFCAPTGKNLLKMGGKGGVSLIQQIDGDQDTSITLSEKTGSVLLTAGGTVVEIGKRGFLITLKSGQQFHLAPTHCKITAPTCHVNGGTVLLTTTPVLPVSTGAGPAAVPLKGVFGS